MQEFDLSLNTLAKLNKQRMEAMKTGVFQHTFERYCFLLL